MEQYCDLQPWAENGKLKQDNFDKDQFERIMLVNVDKIQN